MQLLRPGDMGVYVQYLTLALIRSGYWETISDSFDDNLKSAVIAFQNDNNLTPDGIVGDATWQALMPYLSGYRTVTATDGDSAEIIARRYNTSVQAILTANPGIGEAIAPGTSVIVPLRFDAVPTNVD